MKKFKIKLDVYESTIHFVIGKDKENCEKEIRKITGDSYLTHDDRVFGRYYYKAKDPIIWLPKNPTTPQEYSTLFHEITHAVLDLFDYYDIEVSFKNDEHFTRLISYIGKKAIEELRK